MSLTIPSDTDFRLGNLADRLRSWWVFRKGPSPDVIHHYTDATGLLGIIQAKELWATNIYFLNDSSELLYAFELANDVFDSQIRRKKTEGKHGGVLTRFLELSQQRLTDQKSAFQAFAVCFCQNGNLLSQWREYGSRGGGYSIGLRSDFFETRTSMRFQPPTRLRKIEYGRDDQKYVVKEFIEGFCDLLRNFTRQGFDNRATIEQAANSLASELLECLCCFKSPAFSEEQEWRMIRTSVNARPPSSLRFRSRGGSIVPYLPIPLVPTEQQKPGYPISSVTCGPTLDPKYAVMSLKDLLESHFGWNHSVKVIQSDIPLRGMM